MAKAKFEGPGGTSYTQVAKTSRGRLGVAKVEEGKIRIRIEPSSGEAAKKMASRLEGWNQPNSENLRFSIVVSDSKADSAFKLAKRVVNTDTTMTLKAALAA